VDDFAYHSHGRAEHDALMSVDPSAARVRF